MYANGSINATTYSEAIRITRAWKKTHALRINTKLDLTTSTSYRAKQNEWHLSHWKTTVLCKLHVGLVCNLGWGYDYAYKASSYMKMYLCIWTRWANLDICGYISLANYILKESKKQNHANNRQYGPTEIQQIFNTKSKT